MNCKKVSDLMKCLNYFLSEFSICFCKVNELRWGDKSLNTLNYALLYLKYNMKSVNYSISTKYMFYFQNLFEVF